MSVARTIHGLIAVCFLAACASPAPSEPDYLKFEAPIADARRPAAQRERDAARKPAEMLAFADIKPGAKVADLFPGEGYFTRLFAAAVGDQGKVYAVIRPPETASRFETPIIEVLPAYPNAVLVRQAFEDLSFPEPLDVVFTAQNYHDFHIARFGFDAARINRAVFNALKPGGLYVIVDHAAPVGAPISSAETIHRIDPAIVRREVEAAGFVLDAETDVLRNPEDPLTASVFDPSIRGRTHQFTMRFRKPG